MWLCSIVLEIPFCCFHKQIISWTLKNFYYKALRIKSFSISMDQESYLLDTALNINLYSILLKMQYSYEATVPFNIFILKWSTEGLSYSF